MYDMYFSELDEALLKKLDYSGGCLVKKFSSYTYYESEKKKIKNKNILLGALIKTTSKKEIRKFSQEFRRADILYAFHCSDEVSRTAFEEGLVDIVIPLLSGRKNFMKQLNSGFDTAMARFGANNNVCLGFSFKDFSEDTMVSALMKQNARLCKKYKTPFLILSGAETKYEYISPGILSAFGELIGFDKKQSKEALTITPSNFWNRKNCVMPGVKVID
ncbi:MAG: RNase P subunit p30 family protein [Candidatus Nanoarchaeia archaeon]|nr:RNase P subunit p30 family protein [Candidatus Nanoarchaeia archaeon]